MSTLQRIIILGLVSFALLVTASQIVYAGDERHPTAESSSITKQTLLEGCPIPERREFPINTDINPCTDFYQYTCSKVVASFKLPADRTHHTFSFSDSDERLLYAKKRYFKLVGQQANLSKHAEELRDVYGACIDESGSKAEEQQLVPDETAKIESLKTNEEFQNLIAERIDTADFGFLGLDSIPNQDDPLYLDALLIGDWRSLPERSYYDNKEVVTDLETLATEFFKTIKLDKPEERAKKVVTFEKAFAQVYPLPAEIRERISARNSTTREELLKKYPNLRLTHILDRLPKRTKLRNLTPEVFAFMNDQLEKAPLDVLKDVLLFHSVTSYMDDAYPEFFKKRFQFSFKHLGGPEVRPVREERCTKMAMGDFARELDSELIPILFPDFSEKRVVALAENIRASILDGLKENKWLSPQGKKGAIKKIKSANLLLVQPHTDDEWDFNPVATYNPHHQYANAKLLREKLIVKLFKELSEKRNRRRWEMSPLTVNAYYTPMDNQFVLPIGILQYPMYDQNIPNEENFAAIGSVAGHEMGHGIDDQGAKYDEKGRLHQWMADKDIVEFKKRGAQFIDIFNKAGHNGKLTLGENTADHVGLTFSHRAAFPPDATGKVKNDDPEKEKAFFTQFGRIWCNVMLPKYREMMLKTNPHAMGESRVNEQVKQQPGFQEGFACKAGDKMYVAPENRIRVW